MAETRGWPRRARRPRDGIGPTTLRVTRSQYPPSPRARFRFKGMSHFSHSFGFDPGYGHTLATLCAIEAPPVPDDFAAFWQARYRRALTVDPVPRVSGDGWPVGPFRAYDLSYRTSDGLTLWGWLLKPAQGEVRRGLVVGHGYGGRDGPDWEVPLADAAYLFPCFRGLSRSRQPGISDNPAWHVLHDIHLRDRYIIGGCVDDIWLGVSALLDLFPQTAGHVGYMGISFGGGVGALALPWDGRIAMAHFNVPTFGHQPLRLTLPTVGSGAAVQAFQQQHGHVMDTLRYYDAAVAASLTRIPVHVAAALFDPVVAPPGQFAVYNALAGPKTLFVLDAGHFDYPRKAEQDRRLSDALKAFFAPL